MPGSCWGQRLLVALTFTTLLITIHVFLSSYKKARRLRAFSFANNGFPKRGKHVPDTRSLGCHYQPVATDIAQHALKIVRIRSRRTYPMHGRHCPHIARLLHGSDRLNTDMFLTSNRVCKRTYWTLEMSLQHATAFRH